LSKMPHKFKPHPLTPEGTGGSFRWRSHHLTPFEITRPREKNNAIMSMTDKYDMHVRASSTPSGKGFTHRLAFHITDKNVSRGAPEMVFRQDVHTDGRKGRIRMVSPEGQVMLANEEERRKFTQMAQNVVPLLTAPTDGYYGNYSRPFDSFMKVFKGHYPAPKELAGKH